MDTEQAADEAARRLAELRGAVRLIGEGVAAATDVVQDMHRAISATPLDLLAAAHPVGKAARKVHEGARDGIYAGVRGISRLLFRAARLSRPISVALRTGIVRPLAYQHGSWVRSSGDVFWAMFSDAGAAERGRLARAP